MNPFRKLDATDFDVHVDLADAERHPSGRMAHDQSAANSAGDKFDKDVEPSGASDALPGYTIETLRAEIDLGMQRWRLASKKNS